MRIDEENPWYTIGPEIDPADLVPVPSNHPGEQLAEGEWWELRREGEEHFLYYLRAAQGGGEAAIWISDDAAALILDDPANVDAILLRYGAG